MKFIGLISLFFFYYIGFLIILIFITIIYSHSFTVKLTSYNGELHIVTFFKFIIYKIYS
jgi:hypothetical protein